MLNTLLQGLKCTRCLVVSILRWGVQHIESKMVGDQFRSTSTNSDTVRQKEHETELWALFKKI